MVYFGNYVVGSFVGVVQENGYTSLHVRVGRDTPERPGFVERMNFSPFDPRTGAAVLPVGLREGDVVIVSVSESVKTAQESGRSFVAKRALSVQKSNDFALALSQFFETAEVV